MAENQLRSTLENAIESLKDCNYECFLTLVNLCKEDIEGSKNDLKRLADAFHGAYGRISPELSPDQLTSLHDREGFIGARLFNQAKPWIKWPFA